MNIFRVLCVGNNVAQLRQLRNGLASFGIEVITALHGVDAEVQLKENLKEVGSIVIENDDSQPEGLKFAEHVRKSKFAGRVIVTAHSMTPEREASYRTYNISGFCRRPFSMSVLATMLLQAD